MRCNLRDIVFTFAGLYIIVILKQKALSSVTGKPFYYTSFLPAKKGLFMNIVAITAEYNPFHNGHRYMLHQVRRQLGPDTVLVILMSGSFVQRGEPALIDKWSRAYWAIQNGADCVIELPALYALSNAAAFASGAVRLAGALGCTHLACGVENGTAAEFQELARLALAAPEQKDKHRSVTSGQEMTAALEHAAAPELTRLLREPNALLATEYTKSIERFYPSMDFLPIHRQSCHNDTDITAAMPSASALRRTLAAGTPVSAIAQAVPAGTACDLDGLIAAGAYTDYDRYGDMILYANRLADPEKLRSLPAFAEGLENRWSRVLSQAPTWPAALAGLKTRRYSYSRLCRMGAYTVLAIRQADMDNAYRTGPAYGRVLALNRQGAAFIRKSKERFPIITKIRPALPHLPEAARNMLAYDLAATDIQYLCRHDETARLGRQDYYQSPKVFI
jgi:predicted nucleotidyltransferase